jgi:hypothetical protein
MGKRGVESKVRTHYYIDLTYGLELVDIECLGSTGQISD